MPPTIRAALLLTLILFLPLSPALADDAAVLKDKIARLNLSLRQATLVQSMTQAACFAMADVQQKSSANKALEDLDTFETVIIGLIEGHEWLGLLPTDDPNSLRNIAELNSIWSLYRPAVQQIVAQDYHPVAMRQIIQQSATVADASNTMARAFVADFGADVIDPTLNAAVLLAGHHRMLSQRAILELCFVLADVGGTAMKDRLALTLREFEKSFAILQEGDEAVAAIPNARIGRNYRTAALFWKRMAPVFAKAIAAEPIEETELQKMLKFNSSVLKQLNQAVEGYFQATS